ncbi:MAG: TraR/DksA family transcriptional regulator [Sulfuricella denitrificans]|nr:TraR/DksA family transcriptional regulator [Sulfuricella denitrificans]
MALSAEHQKQIQLALKSRYQQLIDEVRQELGKDGEQHFADFAEAGGSDQGDESVADALADIAAARVDRQVNEMRAIESARKQIREGVYGVCGDCGEDIRFERLLACPTAIRCVNCQQTYEKTHTSENTPSM